MSERKQYKKKASFHITAVQIKLDFDGFTFNKWGGVQNCSAGDWLVNNGGEVYTVASDYFESHFKSIAPGQYEKVTPIWASVAETRGAIKTLEGATQYRSGDYLVYDHPTEGDAYSIGKQTFERMYQLCEPDNKLSEEQIEYLESRLPQQLEWYDRESNKNKIYFHCWQTFAIVAVGLVPIFALTDFKIITALLGGFAAILVGVISLFKFQENWVKYRSTYEDLLSQFEQYKCGLGVYEDRSRAFFEFADTAEQIIGAERGQWAQRSQQKPQEGLYPAS